MVRAIISVRMTVPTMISRIPDHFSSGGRCRGAPAQIVVTENTACRNGFHDAIESPIGSVGVVEWSDNMFCTPLAIIDPRKSDPTSEVRGQ